MSKVERRRIEAYRLREYFTAIQRVQGMTLEEWIAEQAKRPNGYTPKAEWLDYLKNCALIEAYKLAESEAA